MPAQKESGKKKESGPGVRRRPKEAEELQE